MLSKEVSCQELKAEMENYGENNARESSLLTSLRDRVQELEEESAALSTSKIRTKNHSSVCSQGQPGVKEESCRTGREIAVRIFRYTSQWS